MSLQVLKIKEQLCEAEKEIQRLLLENKSDISSNNNSPHSSMEQPHFNLGFGMEGQLIDNNMFFIADYHSTYMTLWDD